MKKLLVFAGSTRSASVSKKLAAAAAKIATASGASVTLIDLADYPAAIYNGDDEDNHGIPESIRELKKLMAGSEGFIIVSPEYNGHITPLLSNIFSWTSRPEGDEKGKIAYDGKKAAIMASSPGKLGGIRVIPRLRDSLAELSVMVVPGFVTLPNAMEAFDDNGDLQDEANQAAVRNIVDTLIKAI